MEDVLTQDAVAATQDVAVAKADTKTIFGADALTLKTPDKVKAVFKIITFGVVVAGLTVAGIKEIPEHTGKVVLEVAGLTTLILQKAEDFWGIKIS